MQTQRIQKLITFSPQLFESIEKKAKKLGISFPEYIRVLAVNDIKTIVENLPLVDEETEKHIARSMQDVKQGKYTVLKDDKDIENHFKDL